jgi:N-acyl-D-aspartate/D-glutamate deacylase
MHDLISGNGKIVDGTGAAALVGDVAIDGVMIASVGGKAGEARRETTLPGCWSRPDWSISIAL